MATDELAGKVRIHFKSYAAKFKDNVEWGCVGIKAAKGARFLQENIYVMFDAQPHGLIFDYDSIVVQPDPAQSYFEEFDRSDNKERKAVMGCLRTIQDMWLGKIGSIFVPGLSRAYTENATINNITSVHPEMRYYFRVCEFGKDLPNFGIYRALLNDNVNSNYFFITPGEFGLKMTKQKSIKRGPGIKRTRAFKPGFGYMNR
jgi:hypothetical protein